MPGGDPRIPTLRNPFAQGVGNGPKDRGLGGPPFEAPVPGSQGPGPTWPTLITALAQSRQEAAGARRKASIKDI